MFVVSSTQFFRSKISINPTDFPNQVIDLLSDLANAFGDWAEEKELKIMKDVLRES